MNETQNLPWGDSLSGAGEGRWAAGRQANETKWKVLRSREGLWWDCRGDNLGGRLGPRQLCMTWKKERGRGVMARELRHLFY